jgi:phosphoglycolate phosphatase
MNIDLSRYSHILWDWNGTLLDDAWLCVEVMNGMLSERNLAPLTLERYRNMFSFPVKDYYVKLGFDFEKEPFEKVGMDFMDLYNLRQGECRLHPESQEILGKIAKKGLPQSVLSAREENELRLEIRNEGIERFFERICGLDDHYAHGKTDVGKKLIADLGLPVEKLLFIGDTLHDSEVAKELGIDCILIPEGHHSLSRLSGSGFQVIPSLQELSRLL